MQKITPNLWFDDQAEEAARFYVSLFKNSKITQIERYSASAAKGSGRPEGSVMLVAFQLDGQDYMALNGGPIYKLNEAISLVVACEDQTEVDYLWDKLLEGGITQACGWLKDKFGLSWQVVPKEFEEMMAHPDQARKDRVMAALMKMTKIDMPTLRLAYEGKL